MVTCILPNVLTTVPIQESLREECYQSYDADVACEFSKPATGSVNKTEVKLISSVSIDPVDSVWNVSVIQCPSGHVTRDFLVCDTDAHCGAKESMISCHSGNVTVACLCVNVAINLCTTLWCVIIFNTATTTRMRTFVHFFLVLLVGFDAEAVRALPLTKYVTGNGTVTTVSMKDALHKEKFLNWVLCHQQ